MCAHVLSDSGVCLRRCSLSSLSISHSGSLTPWAACWMTALWMKQPLQLPALHACLALCCCLSWTSSSVRYVVSVRAPYKTPRLLAANRSVSSTAHASGGS